MGSGFLLLINICTKVVDTTLFTGGISGCTNIPAMKNQPVMCQWNLLFGYVIDQLHLCLVWIPGPDS